MTDEELATPSAAEDNPPKPKQTKLSVISTNYDLDGKGHLTSAEQRARNLAGQGGNITPSTAVDLVKRQDNMEKRLRFQNYVGVVMALGIIAMAVALGVTVSQSNKSTSSAIAKSAVTSVGKNEWGDPRLQDKETGLALTVIAEGHHVNTREVLDTGTNRVVKCIQVIDAARLVNDVANGKEGRVVLSGANGRPKEVVSVGSTFKDDYNFLTFQEMKVTLDTDICNQGIIVGSPEEEEYLQEIGYNASATNDADDNALPLEEEDTNGSDSEEEEEEPLDAQASTPEAELGENGVVVDDNTNGDIFTLNLQYVPYLQ